MAQGEFIPDDEAAFKAAKRPHEGRRVVILIKRFMKIRTTGKPGEDANYNGYFFGVVVVYWMKEMHIDDAKEMYLILKMLYNYKPVLMGEEFIRVPISTKDMLSGPFWGFVQKCCKGFVEQYGYEIPDPTNVVSQEMMNEYHQLGNARNV